MMKVLKILVILQFVFMDMPVWARDTAVDIQPVNSSVSIQINSSSWGRTDCLQGNGVLRKEKKKLAGFNTIRVDGVFNVAIVQQSVPFFEMSADANLFEFIEISVINGQLQISSMGAICPKLPIKINIGLPELKALQGTGADDISISNLNNNQFMITMDGSCDVRITGRTRVFSITMTGAGELDASRFMADTVSIQSSGAGDSKIFAGSILQAHMEGAGDIIYHGRPEQVVVSGDGVGDLIQGDGNF